MAQIIVWIEDKDGTVFYKFTSDTPLPTEVTQLTPAQAFAIELKKLIDTLAG